MAILERDGVRFDIVDADQIKAFKASGYIEAPEAKAPESKPAQQRRRTAKAENEQDK